MTSEFHYRIPWRAQGGHPGHHPSIQSGGDFEFHGYVPLASQPDPRKLDVRATLADPFGQLMVKSFQQRAAIPVYLLADLSASMGFSGKSSKIELLAEFSAACAWSAWRTGDPFGFFGCDSEIRRDLSLPPRLCKGMAAELCERIKRFQPRASHAKGLLEAATELGRQRALVFLASDFHFSVDYLEELLNAFIRHELVPVVVWDSGEYENLPNWGFAELQDPETGERRRLFLRPALRECIREGFAHRREELTRICASHSLVPFFLVDRFDPDAMTNYFFQP